MIVSGYKLIFQFLCLLKLKSCNLTMGMYQLLLFIDNINIMKDIQKTIKYTSILIYVNTFRQSYNQHVPLANPDIYTISTIDHWHCLICERCICRLNIRCYQSCRLFIKSGIYDQYSACYDCLDIKLTKFCKKQFDNYEKT